MSTTDPKRAGDELERCIASASAARKAALQLFKELLALEERCVVAERTFASDPARLKALVQVKNWAHSFNFGPLDSATDFLDDVVSELKKMGTGRTGGKVGEEEKEEEEEEEEE